MSPKNVLQRNGLPCELNLTDSEHFNDYLPGHCDESLGSMTAKF